MQEKFVEEAGKIHGGGMKTLKKIWNSVAEKKKCYDIQCLNKIEREQSNAEWRKMV